MSLINCIGRGGIWGRALFGGGLEATGVNIIEYVTIASKGNATDFGDLTAARYSLASCSSITRGLFGGGLETARVNTIEYVTIASTGNATDFGDLSAARQKLAACSDCHGGLMN